MTVLELLKQRNPQEKENLLLVLKDEDVRMLILGWHTAGARPFKDRPLKRGEKLTPQLIYDAWAPAMQTVDIADVAELAGVSYRTAVGRFAQLQQARLIYPDGTINPDALTIIRGVVGGLLRDMARGPRGGKENAKTPS